MAQQQLNNLESANVFRTKLNDNFTDLYNNKAVINHSSSDNSYGLGSTTMFGHVKATIGNGLNIVNGNISMGAATISNAGTVQLVNNFTTNDSTKAATAAALYNAVQNSVKTYYGTTDPDNSIGKDGDIYIKIE